MPARRLFGGAVPYSQLLTYLKLTDLQLGFLLNWKVTLMKHGIKRMVNKLTC